MYHVILLAIFCTTVSSHWCKGDKPCLWKDHHHHFGHHRPDSFNHRGNYFEHLANKIIHGDESYNNHCNAISNNVQEMYNDDAYILIYSPGFAATDHGITMQAKHRVMNTNIKGNRKEFNDIRILPDIVNVAKAGWYLNGQNVEVVIPYRMNFNVITPATCKDINKETINIPQTPLEIINMYRNGNGSLGFTPKSQ